MSVINTTEKINLNFPVLPSLYLAKPTPQLGYNSKGVLPIPNSSPLDAEKSWCVHADSPVKLLIDPINECIQPQTIHSLFADTVARFATDAALAFKEDPKGKEYSFINYLDYYQLCCQAARGFIKLGLKPFQSVGILGFNSVEWVVSALGAIFAGGLSSGIYTTNSAEACFYVADHSQSAIIVVENEKQLNKILQVRDRLPNLKAIIQYRGEVTMKDAMVHTWYDFMMMARDLPNTDLIERLNNQRPNQCCSLIYTSGSTGNPKAVMISHDNINFTSQAIITERLKYEQQDEVVVSFLPLSHIFAMLFDIIISLKAKVTVYFAQPDALKGSLGVTLKEVRPTMFGGVPRIWEKFAEKMKEAGLPIPNAKIDYRAILGLDRCTITTSGGAPISRDVLTYLLNLGIEVKEGYGLSETTGPHTYIKMDESYMCSVGTTMEGGCKTKLDNMDADGQGEVCIYGRHVFMGYLEQEDKTKEVFDSEGYFHSGDLGKFDGSFLFITGRIKELIITAGGENIAPVPMENQILSNLPCLANAMVIGDKKKFLSLLITFGTEINSETLEPTDVLSTEAQKWLRSVGCTITSHTELISTEPEAVKKAIQAGVNLYNEKAVSRAQVIQKWKILPREFSIPGGEFGPTLKIRRMVVMKMYEDIINEIYKD